MRAEVLQVEAGDPCLRYIRSRLVTTITITLEKLVQNCLDVGEDWFLLATFSRAPLERLRLQEDRYRHRGRRAQLGREFPTACGL